MPALPIDLALFRAVVARLALGAVLAVLRGADASGLLGGGRRGVHFGWDGGDPAVVGLHGAQLGVISQKEGLTRFVLRRPVLPRRAVRF
ncbi:hypothetical protein M885DRAFT_136827 [Pelagophyceae sp. CCMP2097]|nr:hypothetical protein M885DRAFT_136827 [Pelagophyceae sp. CCMP2097]